MDVRDMAALELQRNFPQFGGFRKRGIYKVMGPPVYDECSGGQAVVSESDLWVILSTMGSGKDAFDYKSNNDEKTATIEQIMIFPSLDLEPVPKRGDLWQEIAGPLWRVHSMVSDPGDIHRELLVKKCEE